MNLTASDSLLGRQRSRQWTPLVTQQCRLRHVYQIFALNLPHLTEKDSYYYTLHQTSMSAPFYTSEKVENSNPKWLEIDQRNLTNLGATSIVVRVWKHGSGDFDTIISTWGVHLSGLIYLGNKITEIQPPFFNSNTVIFNIKGGFFTSKQVISDNEGRPPPFVDNLNWSSDKTLYKKTNIWGLKSEVRNSYNLSKLRKLHSLQVSIRNKSLDVQVVREKIDIKFGVDGSDSGQSLVESPLESSPKIRYAPQLLTMKSVNKMLEQKPTKLQRKEMEKMRNEIEIEQFKSKLLSQERDKKSALMRRYKSRLKDLVDNNEETNSDLMNKYLKLNKEAESLRELQKNLIPNRDLLMNLCSQLHHRRRQLLQQLLFIYPIQKLAEKKYTIHGIYVPNSDILSDCSDTGISVALGYITHVLIMSSIFLQVPLRYPMTHCGSRSYITDHVSHILPDRERDFPLFTKGKERIQFTYAVYLLNKNIAQLRWLFFMHTPDLKATLPNLLSFLEGRDFKELPPLVTFSLKLREQDSKIEARLQELPKKYNKMYRSCESGPGLSEILAIPEAFMNKQISSESFRNFVASRKTEQATASIIVKHGRVDETNENNCDNGEEVIEQGTDLLDPSLNLLDLDLSLANIESVSANNETNSKIVTTEQKEFKMPLSPVQNMENPLMARTDALLTTKSFNLVKPKSSM